MEIKSITPTIRETFTLDRASGPVDVTLEVGYVSIGSASDFLPKEGEAPTRPGKVLQQVLIDAVVGWDLTQDGKPIPCTAEKKAEILPVLFGIPVVPRDGEAPAGVHGTLGWRLYFLASNDERFLGN